MREFRNLMLGCAILISATKKGTFMKNSSALILFIVNVFFLNACGEETKETHNKPAVTNPVNTYLDSRVDAMDLAKKSVKESNKRIEKQDKALESLMK